MGVRFEQKVAFPIFPIFPRNVESGETSFNLRFLQINSLYPSQSSFWRPSVHAGWGSAMSEITLFRHQEDFVSDLRRAMGRHPSVLGQAATGFGKTRVGAHIAAAVAAKGRRVIFAVHRRTLLGQTAASFRDLGITYGTIAAGEHYEPHAVMVGSIPTLARRLDRIEAPDLLVIDEAHGAASETWSRVVSHFRARGSRILGLTATPERADGKPLSALFGELVVGPEPRWLMDHGFLSDYRAFCPSQIDLSGVRTQAGDYHRADLEAVVDRPALTGDAAQHYLRLAAGTRAICYGVSIRHSQRVCEHFNAAGIPAAHIDGKTPRDEQQRVIRAFADGDVLILNNVDLITTGFDLSSQVGREVPVETIIGLRPTKSLALHLQMLGRGLRRKPNPAILLDHAGNIRVHGLPDDPRDWSLESRKRRRDTSVVPAGRECPVCHAVTRSVPACPECGHVFPVNERIVEEQAGSLVEIKAAQKAAAREAERRVRAGCKTLDDLRDLARSRGYRPGWAESVWKARLEWASR